MESACNIFFSPLNNIELLCDLRNIERNSIKKTQHVSASIAHINDLHLIQETFVIVLGGPTHATDSGSYYFFFKNLSIWL